MRVLSIHTAKARRLPARPVDAVTAEAGVGLVGDRYHGTRHRHVTIQSRASLDEAARLLGRPIDSAATRRNITVDDGEVPTAPGTPLRIGDAALEVVRISAPCRLLDDDLGPGAARALSRRAGSVCRIVASGTIRVGDVVEFGAAARDDR